MCAGVGEQRLRQIVVGYTAVDRLLGVHDGSQPKPRAARFVTRRVTEAAGSSALAVAVKHGRLTAGAKRDDHALRAAVRTKQGGVHIAFHRKPGYRRRLRAKRSQPVAIVDPCQPAAEYAARPVQ